MQILLTNKVDQVATEESEPAALEVYQDPKGGRGHIEEKMIPDNKQGKTYGSSCHRRDWQEGKLKPLFLGKASA